MKAVIYGSGLTGEKVYAESKDVYDIIAFTDSNETKWGKTLSLSDGVTKKIVSPTSLIEMDYDIVLAGSSFLDEKTCTELSEKYSIKKMTRQFIANGETGILIEARKVFLKNESTLLNNIEGDVAEGGVYQGHFATHINKCFPNKNLHLFDTFEGFDERDLMVEREKKYSGDKYDKGYFNLAGNTIDDVIKNMPYPSNVIIHKGYFPDSIKGNEELHQTRFVFVNLDFDLYKPTKAGLEFFYPRLQEGGIILIHDYFSEAFKGAKSAVDEYCEINNLKKIAIGDGCSIAIQKK